ncbi:QueT transporter family protein [Sediminispirochaeta bajacaliforniensis]|uniref:QueT transporter family protein n=1 Tax=Sediminispirochaeta bajacaliforniensis TaxID=148 RepID=UPI00035C7C2C|nr:QueT transporter family protein [Sediminispirochaeta bajacaliforniensis]
MRDVFAMWKNTKMVVLVALSAGLYAALLIPFKGFVLIPGITEVRPGSALPVVLGLLFGPAGAWGSAIGNLIGDFFGSLGIGSISGFVGNFMFAYVPYKLWINLGLAPSGEYTPDLKSGRKVVTYVVVAILGAAACALPIAWFLDVLGMVPFAALGSIITLNNSIPSIVLGIPVLLILYPRIVKWDLLWTDLMDEEDIPVAGKLSRIGAVIMVISILVGLIGGFLAAFGVGQELLYGGFGAGGDVGSAGVVLIGGIGTAGLIISSFLQNYPKKES